MTTFATIVVLDAKGKEVDRLDISEERSAFSWGQHIYGRQEIPLGWLGRALDDAGAINAGRDPERPSEKAMRLSQRR